MGASPMVRRKLHPHQLQGYAYTLESFRRDGGASLLMEMRLGKTLTAIRAARADSHGGTVLVVTPATTMRVWESELKQEGIRPVLLEGSSEHKRRLLMAEESDRWIIINPEGLRAAPDIAAHDWGLVIADETGGWLTNARSQISKLMLRRLQRVPRRMILTGLPDPNGPEDYVTQMIWAHGSFMGCSDFWKWRLRYMAPRYSGGWELKPGVKAKVKAAVRELAFIKTAKQAGVFVPKVFERRYVKAPRFIHKIYKQIRKDWEAGGLSTKWRVVVETWLAMLAGGIVPAEYDPDQTLNSPHKAKEVVSLLKGELKGKQVVIWTRYRRELKLVRKVLEAAGVKSAGISGLTPRPIRAAYIESFKKGKFQTLVIQQSVGRFALNLSFADAMIFYSNVWDYGVRGQAEARCDDMTKTAPVLCIDLITPGTTDEAVLDALKDKKTNSKNIRQRIMVRAKVKGVA